MEEERETAKPGPGASGILLVNCNTTRLEFADKTFDVTYSNNRIRISESGDYTKNVVITLKNQQVSYKSTILGGFALAEERSGDINYSRYFAVDWEEELYTPKIYFEQPPQRIIRRYDQGQWIELGIENISDYHVTYRDGVEARFHRRNGTGFDFSFSTGFYGSFREDPDGSYTLTFKGDRLKAGEDDYRSQSKFIFSRSKYTGKPLLILQDDATVDLK